MTHQERAERVAEIALAYGYRQQHHIAHTGHTVRRLLEAVSDLIGRRVTVEKPPNPDVASLDSEPIKEKSDV